MAELLVRRVDKTHTDFYLNTKQTKRGDVIVVQPDDWPWGIKELSHPEWIIVRVPKVPMEEFEGLLAAEPETDPKNPSRTLQARAFKLDLDHPAVAKAGLDSFIADLSVEAVQPRPGKALAEVAEVTQVVSAIEDVKVVDGQVIVTKDTFVNEVTKYPVAELDIATASKLPPAVEKVGATCRTSCAAQADPSLIAAITTRKDAIADPKVIGVSRTIL